MTQRDQDIQELVESVRTFCESWKRSPTDGRGNWVDLTVKNVFQPLVSRLCPPPQPKYRAYDAKELAELAQAGCQVIAENHQWRITQLTVREDSVKVRLWRHGCDYDFSPDGLLRIATHLDGTPCGVRESC